MEGGEGGKGRGVGMVGTETVRGVGVGGSRGEGRCTEKAGTEMVLSIL